MCSDAKLEFHAGTYFSQDERSALLSTGFRIIPGPIPTEQFAGLAVAYDCAMASGNGDDLKVASTTTRLNDFVNRGIAFDAIYIHKPLLEACAILLGSPFKLTSMLGRTLRPHTVSQDLHTDIPRDSCELPLAGFILMVDDFTRDNGATRFIPGSHRWPDAPIASTAPHPDEVLACGPAGSMIVFDASIWHGHTANITSAPRRSIQGYFKRRNVAADLKLSQETINRVSLLARHVLAI